MNTTQSAPLGIGLGIVSGTVAFTIWYFRRLDRIRRNPPPSVQRVTGNTAVICSWCADKEAADEWAKLLGFMPSHTICQACRTQHFPQLKNF